MYLMRYFHCDFIRFDFYFVSLLFVCLLVCVCVCSLFLYLYLCICSCIYGVYASLTLCAYTVRTAALPCCLYQFCQMWTKTLKCAKILHKWSSVTAIAVDVAVAVGSAFMLSSWSWSCGQRQKSKCCWYWWADECEVKHTHTQSHTPLSLSLSLFRSRAESLLHAWRELQQQKKAWQASPAKGGLPGSSSERRQRRWQRQTKSASGNRVCYWAEHTHTHTVWQARARSPCQLRARKCAMLFVGSAQAPLCSGLRQQHVATPGSRDGQQQQVALINVSGDPFTCSLSFLLSLALLLPWQHASNSCCVAWASSALPTCKCCKQCKTLALS